MPAEEDLLRHLHEDARAADFVAANLPPAALEMLLELQFRAQATSYAAQFPDARSLIILHRDAPVGRVLLAADERRWRIIDIALLSAVRGQGIGTDVIEAVLRAAIAEGAREVTLSVLFNNAGARRLYGRLGFAETGEGVHVPMTRRLQSGEPSRS